jgi:hypothetical protein
LYALYRAHQRAPRSDVLVAQGGGTAPVLVRDGCRFVPAAEPHLWRGIEALAIVITATGVPGVRLLIDYFDKRDAQTRVNRRAPGPRSLRPTECANQTSGVASHLGSISLAHFFGSMSSMFSISIATWGC